MGYLMCLSGLAYLAQRWVLGVEGFSAVNTRAILLGIVVTVVWSVWLVLHAWVVHNDKAPQSTSL